MSTKDNIKSKIEHRLKYLKERREELPVLIHNLESQMVELRTEYLRVSSTLEELNKLIEMPELPQVQKGSNKEESK